MPAKMDYAAARARVKWVLAEWKAGRLTHESAMSSLAELLPQIV